MLFAGCAASSFSTVRKKQRAQEGGVRIQPIDCHLTFTHHFRLRRSPYWGRVMRKRPLDSPRPHRVVLGRSRLPHMGLAGACRGLTFPLFVGAPLPCTASRRGRNSALFRIRSSKLLRLQYSLQRNPSGDFAMGCFRCKRRFIATLSNRSRHAYAAA